MKVKTSQRLQMQFIKPYLKPRMLLTFLIQHTPVYIWETAIKKLYSGAELIRAS